MVGFKVGHGGDGDWNNGNEILSYSGLINTDPAIYTTNPSMRAALGWQVYDVAPGSTPSNPTDASFSNPETWDSDWAYLADKSNHVADADGVRAGTVLDEGIITGTTPSGDNIYNYALIAYGGIGQGLAQHPMNDTNGDRIPEAKSASDNDNDGKLDAAVYLAARFANTDYSDPDNPQHFVLPGGTYSTRLYIELIHE